MAVESALSSGRIAAGRGVRLLLVALLSGTAAMTHTPSANAFELFGFKLFGSDEEDDDVVDPLHYTVTLTVEGGDEKLKDDLDEASSLVQDVERPVSGSLGLLAKARSDREQLVAALYAQARYDGVVQIAIAGQSLDDIAPDADFGAGPVPVTITIDPGAVFTLDEIKLEGDAANLMPAEFGLIPGGNAGSAAILRAEAEIVRRLKEDGRPLAQVTGRDVVADHETATLDVTLAVEAGPIAGYGPTTVSGAETMDPGFTAYVTGLKEGRQYSPREVDEARDRLLALGVFSSVTVSQGTALDANGQIPIEVEVTERKLRYYGVGATYSNTEGLGIEGYWGHRNLFGRGETLRIEGSIGRIGDDDVSDVSKLNYNAAILFEKPAVVGPDSKFFSRFRTVYEHPDAYDRFSTEVAAGLSYQFTRTQSASVEASLEYEDVTDFFHPDGQRHLIASLPTQYVFDNRDNKLDPKRGFRALAFAEPAHDFLTGATFVKLRGELSAYRAIDDAQRFVLAGRVATGSIFGASLEQIPADRRFYVGGGGSVRGYEYQGIGPKDPDGNPIGGRSYMELSTELRVQVTETIGIVPFIDAGAVSEDEFLGSAGFKVGAGVGLRYLMPFGPLRIDAAVPLNPGPDDPDFGIYAGVGQAF
ncbi:autotransporter assembly complex family protein [Mesorhizobium sp. YM1C-6-2]|uniref:autotransporter assembly complex protein TamA n=1 Tax=Mesorhizobium sp. YM1C-6-2 TaxID=1827501 RepID=UPI000EF1DA0E|nr:autotransporter assembly complex family protein [Mesorhizobium sp. YM1C-6-2]RLP27166.1 outer membrane protein assembly factor [Mesorhizobium sp. YM1C-6-2]